MPRIESLPERRLLGEAVLGNFLGIILEKGPQPYLIADLFLFLSFCKSGSLIHSFEYFYHIQFADLLVEHVTDKY